MSAEVKQADGEIRRVPYPGMEGAPNPDNPHDLSHMIKISAMIADLQSIFDRWGDTCVYIRRGGCSWGSVALHRRAYDEKHGIFDIQAQHDRDMQKRLEQIERLKADRDGEREAREKSDRAYRLKEEAMQVLWNRLIANNIDVSDLVS